MFPPNHFTEGVLVSEADWENRDGNAYKEAEKIGVSSKRVEAETLHRIRSEQGRSSPLPTGFTY